MVEPRVNEKMENPTKPAMEAEPSLSNYNQTQDYSSKHSLPQPGKVYSEAPTETTHTETPQETPQEYTVSDHFGIFPNIPTLIILKLCSIIFLVILVELNIILNLNTLHSELRYIFGRKPDTFLGITLIGVFLGILFRYISFELKLLKLLANDARHKNTRIKTYITLFFLIAIGIFIALEVIVELLYTRAALAFIDLMNILIVTLGTYAVFAGSYRLVIVSIIFTVLIMFLGTDVGGNIPILAVFAILMILYIEISEGAIRLQKNVERFHEMVEHYDSENVIKYYIDLHMNKLSNRFILNLSIFFVLTLIIASLLLLIFTSYSYLTPTFINENLELQTVYAILPILAILFTIFLSYYIYVKFILPTMQSKNIE